MTDNKFILSIVLFAKYFILFSFTPDLELLRYSSFFESCKDISSCLNPYSEILNLEYKYLTFPYGNLMYFIMLPFYFLATTLNISFVNLSYIFFELIILKLLKKMFKLSNTTLYFVLILNPVIVYSVGFVGQLDIIPLLFFLISLHFLNENRKYYSILFLIFSLSSKIIFLILLPTIVLYFLKIDESIKEVYKTIFFTLFVSIVLNFQFLIDDVYREAVTYGITRGYSVVNTSEGLFQNNVLFLLIFLSIIFLLYWQNIHRLDFIGVCIFAGFMTFPIYMTNLLNLGWSLWSFPAFVIIFYSYKPILKIIIFLFFACLVFINLEINITSTNEYRNLVFRYLIYLGSFLILYLMYEALTKNIYFKIKSSPIIVSIAGDSAVGKSSLSLLMQNYFGKKFVDTIELDSFHKFERNHSKWKEKTHLNPEMNELIEFKNTVNNLLKGKTEIIRNYNHMNGKFDTSSKKRVKNFLIIEGLHALYFNDLNKKFDLNIFLELEENIKDETKVQRDLERNKQKNKILAEIEERKVDYIKYIMPQAQSADLFLKTISRQNKKIKINIIFKIEYFYEFKSLLLGKNEIQIINENHENDNISFDLVIPNNEINYFFKILTKNIHNLHSLNFDYKSLELEKGELVCKLALSLFILNKKIEIKL